MAETPSPTSGRESRWLYAVGLPLLLAVAYAVHSFAIGYVSDDGFIGFQYVKHFLLGDGFVYNNDERVEGYTNFLWLALLAGVLRLLPSLDLLLLSQVLGVFFGGAAVWAVCRFSRNIANERGGVSLLAGAFLAAHTSFAAWATSGLETAMFALVLFTAAHAYVVYLRTGERFWLPPVLFAFVTMVRPDGMLFAAVTGLHFVVWESRRRGTLAIARPTCWALIFAAIFGSYFAARFSFYGEFLPNTFYAKVVGTTSYELGWRYVGRYIAVHGLLVFVPALWLLISRGSEREQRVWQDYFAVLVLSYTAYVIYVGGDGLAFFRFFAHIAPLLYLLVQAGYAEAYRSLRTRFTAVPESVWVFAAIAIVAVSLGYGAREGALPLLSPESERWFESHSQLHFPGTGADHDYTWFDNYFVARQAIAADWLEQNAAPNSLVAATPAGSISYHMSHRVIDMLGLNDHHIARSEPGTVGYPRAGHMKGDGAYVLARKPDYILMGNVAVLPVPLDEVQMAEKTVRKSEHEIWSTQSFHRDYELVNVRLADSGPFQYFSFYKRRAP